MRKREIKIIVQFRSVPTRCVIEISKQIAKNCKKLKNTIVASFKAKIGWKRLGKRENKNYRSVPTRFVIENSNKKKQKNSEN